jgi:hypothetical protein
MSANPTMPEIRTAMDQARNLAGREDTETFSLEAPALLARLVQYLDLYVGHEPTLAEEEAHVRRERRAEVLRAVVDRLANRAALYGDSSTVNAVMYDLTAVAENEARLGDSEPERGHAARCSTAETSGTPDFFQPGTTYTTGIHSRTFYCTAVGPYPFTGEIRAHGWLTRDGWPYPTVEALDPDDWKCGGWTAATTDLRATTRGEPGDGA